MASSCTVRSCAMATGATLSWTVTVNAAVEVLPLTSVTVKFTVWSPTSSQSKSVWLNSMDAMPQLSEEELFACPAR